ncbi:MAG TPA: glycosyltransferase, partial [Bacteroidales bacterium]|nr:glycosyltransferase [Bacteroidales bacterium]
MPKPRLSVIIVSYNCAAFLGLTLHALLWKKQDGLEVLVVDNASSDDTAALLRSRFPQVELVLNAENVGFGRACNQGMERARGEYLLMLNPDTYVPEDLCERVVDFMDQHPDGGAMGVRMLDGRGRFLPES